MSEQLDISFIPTQDPLVFSQRLVGRVNAVAWHGRPARGWLCVSVNTTPIPGTRDHRADVRFLPCDPDNQHPTGAETLLKAAI